MYNQVYNHFVENKIQKQPKQFGFQINTSTKNAVLELVRNITKSFEKSKYVLGVFIYLKKALDIINHDILLYKLKLYGVNGTCLEWFKSYLSNRNQCIFYEVYNNIRKCVYLDILCGMPQGSILGPLLFLIYVNDDFRCPGKLHLVMFAEDTNLFISGIDVDEIFSDLRCELNITYRQI